MVLSVRYRYVRLVGVFLTLNMAILIDLLFCSFFSNLFSFFYFFFFFCGGGERGGRCSYDNRTVGIFLSRCFVLHLKTVVHDFTTTTTTTPSGS